MVEYSIGFLIVRSFFITIMTLGMMASLTDFRFSVRKLLVILLVYLSWVAFSCGVLLYVGGEVLLLRVFLLNVSFPAILISYWAAKDTPALAVFNYMTQIVFSLLAASFCRMLTELWKLPPMMNFVFMCLFYLPVIWLEWRFLRQPFRALAAVLPTRWWWVLTPIPCIFCAYLILLATWPQSYMDNDIQRIYLYTAILPLLVVYISVFIGLHNQYYVQLERQNAALVAIQVSALQQKLQATRDTAETVNILRHDLRHRLQTAAELVARGDREEALAFLDAAQMRLNQQKPVRWCRPPVLDAMFSSYFEQARRQEIAVDAQIALPDQLPVDEGELAVVFANALENAIHACAALPPEQRALWCKVISRPSIMLEISNPCAGPVTFDRKGLPVSSQQGHGLGSRSIYAFCQKYGASLKFCYENGWFSMRLVL